MAVVQLPQKLYFRIGEVARLVGVATHVLRYWETQFTALRPVKRADGRRHYRPDDVLLVAGICEALHEEGLTIRGARRLIAMDGGAGLRARGHAPLAPVEANEVFVRLPRRDIARLRAAGLRAADWPMAEDGREAGTIRLVTGWTTTAEEIAALMAAL